MTDTQKLSEALVRIDNLIELIEKTIGLVDSVEDMRVIENSIKQIHE
jgi:hypothetical protein